MPKEIRLKKIIKFITGIDFFQSVNHEHVYTLPFVKLLGKYQ